MPPSTTSPTPSLTTTTVTSPTTTACTAVDGMDNAETPITAADVTLIINYKNGTSISKPAPEPGSPFEVEVGVESVSIIVRVEDGEQIDKAKLVDASNIKEYDVSVMKANNVPETVGTSLVNIYINIYLYSYYPLIFYQARLR